ncbi:OsmC family protein [Belnapia sp. T18]|uniref:OsmC family protein n=1 Tax=Belnapia arida TaxID=2804533 RepID=A0ABS1UDX7_9PROT|nr:OsmC family protein [Belnapia arida]MBL6081892.1 OsmC family protein [Belnapia arida]
MVSPLHTLRCRTVAASRFRQLTHIRDLPVLIVDEPSGISDPDPAPHPLEILLAALGSDLAIGIRAMAVTRGVTLSSLELEVEADMARAPLDSGAPPPLGLEAVRVAIHIAADAPREALAALIMRATLRSPVANTLHDGTQLSVALAAGTGV